MELVLAVMVAVLALGLLRSVLREYARAARNDLPTEAEIRLRGARWCEFEIESDVRVQPALALIAGSDPEGVSHHCEAVLLPEFDEAGAVAGVSVAIDGHPVGRFAREDAELYAERMAELDSVGKTAACPAFISGGGEDEEGARARYLVKLGLAWPPEFEALERGPDIDVAAMARLKGQSLSEEDAWHSPPVPTTDDAALARAFPWGAGGRVIAFAGWSDERLPYLQAVSRAAGLVVADPDDRRMALLCVGPRAHRYHLEPARAAGAAVVSGEQLQVLMERTLASPPAPEPVPRSQSHA